jgi:YHS domain-containing protein
MTMTIDAHAMAGSHCLAPSCRREPTLRRFTMLCNWLSRNRIAVVGFTFFSTILILGGLVVAAEPEAGVDKKAKEDTYPLTTCIVSGQQLGSMGEPFVYTHEGREIRFCCAGCVKRFEKDPDAYMKKMDQAIIASELSDYPLDICVVRGDRLGTMGEPVDYVYDNHLVRFCCGGCIKAFEKEPDRYMAILNKAREVQAAERSPKPYPLDTCLVSGGKLGSMGEPVTHVYTGQELQFCCRGCIPRFEEDPEKYMEKLQSMEMDQAEKPHQSKESGGDRQ